MPLRPFADMYCWCCHLEDSLYTCKKCPRTYHRRCVFEMPNYPEPVFEPESMDPSSMNLCPECVVADDTILNNMKKVHPTELKSILRYVIQNLKSDEYWFKNFYEVKKPKSNSRSRAIMVKFVDISTLEKSVEEEQYKTLEGFFGDVKWIRHNVAITSEVNMLNIQMSSNVDYLLANCNLNNGINFGLNIERSDEMTTAEKLLHFVAVEMLEIDLCHECYVRKQSLDKFENWFLKACSRPHLLGWAKQDRSAYWPVKIMGVDMGKKLAIVHFFGEHNQEEVPLKHCLIYTADPPHSMKKLKGQIHGWKSACKEMRKHLEYLEERHGKVVFAEEKKRITTSLTEAVQRMFPDWKLKHMNEDEDDLLENEENVESVGGEEGDNSDNDETETE